MRQGWCYDINHIYSIDKCFNRFEIRVSEFIRHLFCIFRIGIIESNKIIFIGLIEKSEMNFSEVAGTQNTCF